MYRAGQPETGLPNPVLGCLECAECKSGRPNLCAKRTVIGVNAPYTGAFAERMAIPAGAALRLPDAVSDDGGAVVEPLAVGIHAVGRAEVRKGDHVAVLGAGMIGLVTVWAALHSEAAEVFATDFRHGNLDIARFWGLHRSMPARPYSTPSKPKPAVAASTG